MEKYQRLAKRLVVLGYEQGTAASGAGVMAGDEPRVGGSRVGQITSVAPLGGHGVLRALEYVKTVTEPGYAMSVGAGESGSAGTVFAVPGEA